MCDYCDGRRNLEIDPGTEDETIPNVPGFHTSARQALLGDLDRHNAIEACDFPAASRILADSQWGAITVGA